MTENESKTTRGLPSSSDVLRGSWQDHEYFHPSAVKGFQLQNTPWRTSEGVIAMGGPADNSCGIGCIAARIAWLNDSLPPSEFQLMTFPAIASALCWFYIVEGIKRRAMSALRGVSVKDPWPHSSFLSCPLSSPPPSPIIPILPSYCLPFNQPSLLLIGDFGVSCPAILTRMCAERASKPRWTWRQACSPPRSPQGRAVGSPLPWPDD